MTPFILYLENQHPSSVSLQEASSSEWPDSRPEIPDHRQLELSLLHALVRSNAMIWRQVKRKVKVLVPIMTGFAENSHTHCHQYCIIAVAIIFTSLVPTPRAGSGDETTYIHHTTPCTCTRVIAAQLTQQHFNKVAQCPTRITRDEVIN